MGAETVDPLPDVRELEPERLTVETRAYQQFTRELLQDAGLRPGMRVLEIGTGSGDVAMLAAEMVGPNGQVIGVDQSCETIEQAKERARSRGLENVQFECASLQEPLSVGSDFDALVGRLVLMYLPTPAVHLRRLVRHVKPGGFVAFQEINLLGARSVPSTPTLELAENWVRETFARSGIEVQMGPKLHGVFRAAGLPSPEMRVDGLISASEGVVPALMTDVIRTILPMIEHIGLATRDEVDIDTLEDRMRAELEAEDATLSSPLLVGAWARLPA